MSRARDSDWRAAARAAADLPPAAPRAPPCGSASDVVGSIEPAIAARLADAGLPLAATGDGRGWRVAAPPDASLAAIARWLHEQGLSAPWRDERLAVDAVDGRTLGAVERAVVRVLGITTRAVHLVGFAPDGRVWVQQRAFDKAIDPGRWDTLMGGQVGAGESVEDTLERETHGRGRPRDRRPASMSAVPTGSPCAGRSPRATSSSTSRSFEATVPDGVVPRNRDGEVERFECLAAAPLHEQLAGGAFTLEATLILDRSLARRAV